MSNSNTNTNRLELSKVQAIVREAGRGQKGVDAAYAAIADAFGVGVDVIAILHKWYFPSEKELEALEAGAAEAITTKAGKRTIALPGAFTGIIEDAEVMTAVNFRRMRVAAFLARKAYEARLTASEKAQAKAKRLSQVQRGGRSPLGNKTKDDAKAVSAAKKAARRAADQERRNTMKGKGKG